MLLSDSKNTCDKVRANWTAAQKEKLTHYSELAKNYQIQPIAMETLGAWGAESLKFVKEIGQRISDNRGDKRSSSFLLQALSMAVQRGNVASIRGSMPSTKTLHEIHYYNV